MTAKKAQDATQLLDEDHKNVKKMFEEYKKLVQGDGEDGEKFALAQQICLELSVHAQVEEELFYEPVREAIDDDDLLDEATVEHASAKELIAQILEMEPSDDYYDAKVTVLGEYIDHHVKEEREEMFPKARKSKLDLVAIGEAIATRKEELMADPEAVLEKAREPETV